MSSRAWESGVKALDLLDSPPPNQDDEIDETSVPLAPYSNAGFGSRTWDLELGFASGFSGSD